MGGGTGRDLLRSGHDLGDVHRLDLQTMVRAGEMPLLVWAFGLPVGSKVF